jgi:hypothetical protein
MEDAVLMNKPSSATVHKQVSVINDHIHHLRLRSGPMTQEVGALRWCKVFIGVEDGSELQELQLRLA